MTVATASPTVQTVIDDWYASRAPRDPYDDLGVLVHEVERLRRLVAASKHGDEGGMSDV